MKSQKFIFVILCSVFCLMAKAQNQELFNHTWYLQKMVINGVNHFPPSNTEVPWVDLNFSDNPDASFQSSVCNSAYGNIAFDNMADSFEFIDWAVTLGTCDLPINNSFGQIYFPFYEEYTYNNVQPFDYKIEDGTDDEKTLTITSIAGDEAIYSNKQLSIQKKKKSSFNVYPNPAENFLYVQNSLPVQHVKIYDMSGRCVSYFKSAHSAYDISNLQSGLYFVEIITEQSKAAEKLIKK